MFVGSNDNGRRRLLLPACLPACLPFCLPFCLPACLPACLLGALIPAIDHAGNLFSIEAGPILLARRAILSHLVAF